jgi:hypothetical protein
MKITPLTLSTLFTGALLVSAPGIRAHGGEDHGGGAGHAAEPAGAGLDISGQAGLESLHAHLKAIQAELDSAKLDRIHGHAMAIDSAAQGLDRDPGLDAARKKRVQGYAKNIARLADALHDAADGNKLPETQKAFGKLKAQVDLLDKQFAHARQPGAAHPEGAAGDSMK